MVPTGTHQSKDPEVKGRLCACLHSRRLTSNLRAKRSLLFWAMLHRDMRKSSAKPVPPQRTWLIVFHQDNHFYISTAIIYGSICWSVCLDIQCETVMLFFSSFGWHWVCIEAYVPGGWTAKDLHINDISFLAETFALTITVLCSVLRRFLCPIYQFWIKKFLVAIKPL